MVTAAQELGFGNRVGRDRDRIIHQLERVNPAATFEAVNPAAVCRFMKMTPPTLAGPVSGTVCTRSPVDEVIRKRALASVERMIAIGTPSPSAE